MAPALLNPARFAAAGGSGYAAAVLADGPVAYYRLGDSGGTMVDSSGNSHNGTYTGSPTRGVPGALTGDSDTAVTFNGSSQEATAAYWAGLDTIKTNFSIEAWAKTTVGGAVGGHGGGSNAPYQLYVSSGKAALITKAPTQTTVSGATSVDDDNWHHLVATLTGGTARIYVDGTLDGSGSTPTPQSLNSFGVSVASRGSSSFFGGTIDEFALYSGALSAARVAAHYAAR